MTNPKLTQNIEALSNIYAELVDFQGSFYHTEATEFNVRLQGYLSSDLEYKLTDMGFVLYEDDIEWARYIKGNVKINLENVV